MHICYFKSTQFLALKVYLLLLNLLRVITVRISEKIHPNHNSFCVLLEVENIINGQLFNEHMMIFKMFQKLKSENCIFGIYICKQEGNKCIIYIGIVSPFSSLKFLLKRSSKNESYRRDRQKAWQTNYMYQLVLTSLFQPVKVIRKKYTPVALRKRKKNPLRINGALSFQSPFH